MPAIVPSAVFRSPERKDIFTQKDVPDLGRYQINYALVEKAPVIYSISKTKKHSEVPKLPDSFLSSNLHQFPGERYKGIPFQYQTPRRDITDGMPSPHEERFTLHNLVPKSCSKFTSNGSPDMAKYAKRTEFYKQKEFSPDYTPNKEYVLPKIIHNIMFKNMSERKDFTIETDWPKIYDVNMARQEKRSLIEELAKKAEKRKEKRNKKSPRAFSPSHFAESNPDLAENS